MIAEGVTPSLGVVVARVVVCPTENREYRNAVASTPLARRFPGYATVEHVMRRALKDPHGIRVVASEDLVAGVSAATFDGGADPWLDYQRRRYGRGVATDGERL
jgi:hypothetical protein